MLGEEKKTVPDSAHQTIYKEFVLFCRCFLARAPYFAVAPLHQPSFEIDGVFDIDVVVKGFNRKRFEGCMKVSYAVLGQ